MNNENNTGHDRKDEDVVLSPLDVLATSVAYEIKVDGRVSSQQRGQLIALFGKLVETGAIQEGDLQAMISRAFTYTANNRVEDFIKKVTPTLTDTQRLSIVINLYESMQVDGQIKMSERSVIEKFEQAFAIDRNIARGIREFLSLKNDTSIFLDMSHPLNNKPFDPVRMFTGS